MGHDLAAANADLAAQKMFTDSLLASAGAGIVACDRDGHLTLMNRTARGWHGLDPDAVLTLEQLEDLTNDLFEADGTTPMTTQSSPLMRAFRDGTVSNTELRPGNAGAGRCQQRQ